MYRVTDAFLHKQIERMRVEGMDVELDGQYGRFAICTVGGGRKLSPRASNREISEWLDAFRQGWDAAKTIDAKHQLEMGQS